MIKEKKIKINISYRNKTHYLKLGYDAVLNNELEIEPEHLPSGSHVKITAICDICGSEKKLIYHKYIENKKRYNFYGCKKCSRQKAALTSIDRYGVDNYSKTDEYKERVEKTNMLKYGYKTNLLNPEYKEKIENILFEKYGSKKFYEINRLKSERNKDKKKFKLINMSSINFEDSILSEELYDDIHKDSYHLYKNECRRLSKKSIKLLFENWDGYDYYDGEYIKDNLELDHIHNDYPSVDHKISIYYGFKNDIPPIEISDIKNLCITKRWINSTKRDSNEL